MKLALSAGLVTGLIFVAPALAAPTVTVRVEGAAATLVGGARVTTSTQPVVKDGHQCSGTSAGGALDGATAGNWDATYNAQFQDFFINSIMGEKPPGNDYWSLWVNHRYATVGACNFALQEGDDVLFLVDQCDDYDSTTQSCRDQVLPLGLTAPATVTAGASAQVTVVRYDAGGDAAPVAGASVGGAVTDAAGHATLSFAQAGMVVLRAEKPGFARSESETVAVAAPSVVAAAPDRAAPAGGLTGLRDGQVLASGPRVLRGSFSDASGVRVVKLRLTRRVGNRCWYFSGRLGRFRGTHCGRGPYFGIGDRGDWSYLLPARLATGRYVLDAVAIDGAGNRTPLARGTTRVVFQVR